MEELLDQISTHKKKTLEFRWGIALIWVSVFMVGFLFKFIMHWPLPFKSLILQIIGISGFAAYSLSLLFLASKRNLSLIICSILSFLWISKILWGILFNSDHSQKPTRLAVEGIAFGVLFALHFGIFLIIKKVRKNQK
ncbi:hypothetical protein D3C71_584080 [compost metagenome]